jgi:hypothetical protein
MPYFTGDPLDFQGAAQLVISSYEQLAAQELSVQYANIVWRSFIPEGSIDGNVAPGVDIYSKRVKDRRGMAAFRATSGNDIPTVGMSMRKVSVPIQDAAVSANIDLRDIDRLQYGFQMDAIAESVSIMREATERLMERNYFYGAAELAMDGLINNANVPQITVPVGAGGFTTWSTKTPDEILFDLNVGILTPWNNSRLVFLPNMVWLPPIQYGSLTGTKAGTTANDYTIMNYFGLQNVHSAITGGPIIVKPLRYLEGAGVGGTDRMMSVTFDPTLFMKAESIPFTMLEPQRLAFNMGMYAITRFSSNLLPWPTSMLYSDGI